GDRELRAGHLLHGHPALFVLHPLDVACGEPVDLAVLALEALGRDGEITLGALLVRRGRAQLQWPVGPGELLVLVLGRAWHEFEVRDRSRALPERGADAVAPGISSADDDDVLARREDLVDNRIARDLAVLLRQELHREVDAQQLTPGHSKIARLLGAS